MLALLAAQASPRGLQHEALQLGGVNFPATRGATYSTQDITGLQGAIRGSQTEPSPTPTQPATTTPTAAPSPGVAPDPAGGNGALFDPRQWVIDALSAAFAWVVDGITSTITNLLQQAFSLDILILTPPTDTYQNTVVLDFWRTVVAIADSALAIIVCWVGYNSIVGPTAGVRYHEARQVLPRLALAALAVNLSLLVTQTMIDLNNALSAIVTTPFDNLANLLAMNIRSGPNAAASLALILLFLAFGVVGLFLVIQMVARLAMLDVLIVTAPLGLVCWVLPQIMEADERQSCFLEQWRKAALQNMVGAERATSTVGENQIFLMPIGSDGGSVLILTLPMATQCGNCYSCYSVFTFWSHKLEAISG